MNQEKKTIEFDILLQTPFNGFRIELAWISTIKDIITTARCFVFNFVFVFVFSFIICNFFDTVIVFVFGDYLKNSALNRKKITLY
jgi:hypothetical protein